jgi:membrane protease YdiL (CAAX protease family)
MQMIKTVQRSVWIVIRAVLSGLIISTFAGSTVFAELARLNGRFHPELPWAACVNLLWLGLVAVWLNGWGWPRSTSAVRNYSLRLWRPPRPWESDRTPGILLPMALIGAIYVYFIVVATLIGGGPPPDLSAYPTTAMRLSALIMGALSSGVGEEMAFRGYMQSQLERFGPAFAIGVTSVVFMLAHAPQDLQQFVRLALGYLILGLLWGALAYRAGTILPGMLLHVAGDLAAGYFVYLGGRGDLLFVH